MALVFSASIRLLVGEGKGAAREIIEIKQTSRVSSRQNGVFTVYHCMN